MDPEFCHARRAMQRHVLGQIVTMVASHAAVHPFQASRTKSRAFSTGGAGRSVLTFVFWMWLGPEPKLAHALVSAVAVLIIACRARLASPLPCPSWSVSDAARRSVLVKNAEALERLEKVTTLVVDKTGTLTRANQGSWISCRSPGLTRRSSCVSPPRWSRTVNIPRCRRRVGRRRERGLCFEAVTEFRS